MTNIVKPTPYPADTKAKGWRFELDLEQVRQSDTWALAAPAVRPWLFMLWATAWDQVPCGSLPNDDALIAARIGMDAKAFTKARSVLLRGWWLAEDGRLYQDTIVARVLSMLDKRMKDAERAAKNRARKAEYQANNDVITRLSRVTPDGLHSEFDTKHQAPSTKHQAPEENTHTDSSPPELVRACSLAGQVCMAMKGQGVSDVNPGHTDLLMLIEAGAAVEEFEGAAREAVAKGKGFAYAVGTVKRRRIEAAQTASQVLQGPMPRASPSRKDRQLTTAALMTGAAVAQKPAATEYVDVIETPRIAP